MPTTGPKSNDEQFGKSVSIFENMCIIGAPGNRMMAEITGSAYVFGFNSSVWTEREKLIAPDAEIDDWSQ